jgi:hypothetical protein
MQNKIENDCHSVIAMIYQYKKHHVPIRLKTCNINISYKEIEPVFSLLFIATKSGFFFLNTVLRYTQMTLQFKEPVLREITPVTCKCEIWKNISDFFHRWCHAVQENVGEVQ